MKRIFNPIKKKTILLVDDDQVFLRICGETLRGPELQTVVVSTYDEVLQKLLEDSIDLVLLDLSLPGTDGIELIKHIRSRFGMQALPVIAFSNSYLADVGRLALQAGATECLTKIQSTPAQIFQTVRSLLSLPQRNPADKGLPLSEQMAASLLKDAPEKFAQLRDSHQNFAKADHEDKQKDALGKMHRSIRSLAGSANLLGLQKIAQTSSALEALLIKLRARTNRITPSVIRTVAQGIDTLSCLFDAALRLEPEDLNLARILVVDDEIISRETICSALEKANLTATTLDDSIAAQRLLELDRFDLIFLDVEMPGQNGLDLCVKIRAMAANSTTPVVFVTAHSDFGSRAQSILCGGNDFIAKPFLSVELALKALTCLFRKNFSPVVSDPEELVPTLSLPSNFPAQPLLASKVAG